MRVVAGKKLADRVSIEKLATLTRMKTLNHMAAEEMLMLVWQGLHDENSPLWGMFTDGIQSAKHSTRARTRGDLMSGAITNLGRGNFPHPAIQVWNTVDPSLRTASTKSIAKKHIRQLVQLLPL